MKITQEELTRMRDAASRGQASPRDMRRVLDALDASEAETAWLSRCLAGACVKNRSGRCFLDGVSPCDAVVYRNLSFIMAHKRPTSRNLNLGGRSQP